MITGSTPSCAYFTICSLNYVAYALTLFRSLEKADPIASQNFHLVLVDEVADVGVLGNLPFQVTLAKDLGIETFWDMAVRYTVMEMNTAVKPAAFKHLLYQHDYTSAIYLDPDIFVVRPLTDVHEAIDAGHDIVLTPHALSPLNDGKDPDDQRLMMTGVYNLGFLACSNSPSALSLLDWWDERMKADCRVDLENGLFVDQKFMDLSPAYVDNPKILRHPGYNVAYWNLVNRSVSATNSGWKVNGQPLHFFHFSGIVPGDRTIFSKHQNRFTPETIGDAKFAFEAYLDELENNNHTSWKSNGYAYNCFNTGAPIPSLYRELYALLKEPARLSRDSAFMFDEDVLNEVSENTLQMGTITISRAMFAIWQRRPDLQSAFPLTTDAGRISFARWYIASAKGEYNLPDEAIEPVRQQLGERTEKASSSQSGRWLPVTKNWAARKMVNLAPRLRPVYRLLPNQLRISIRNKLLDSAARPSFAGRILSRSSDRFDPQLSSGANIWGLFDQVSGVGEGARRMVEAVKRAGIQVTQNDIEAQREFVEASNLNRVSIFHLNADQTQMHLDKLGRQRMKGQYRIGYWAWELETLPAEWDIAFEYVDEIWTPSTFVQASVQKSTSLPVHVVPHTIQDRQNSSLDRKHFNLPDDKFLFFLTYDRKSFVSRKNPEGAYEAFCKAFPEGDEGGPNLVIKAHGIGASRDTSPDFLEQVMKDDRVIVFDGEMTQAEYNGLQRCCDALISLHRSEGFGLNLLEFMAMGKPVIATNYGGNTDFIDADTGYPISFTPIPLKPGDYPHGSGQKWAEP